MPPLAVHRRPRHRTARAAAAALAALAIALPAPTVARAQGASSGSGGFTMEQVLSYPFPMDLVAAPSGTHVAWVLDLRGVRNIWGASAPDWTPRQLTSYTEDDGQELTNLSLSPDGNTVVYTRGGDHDANWEAEGNLPPDPSSSPEQPKVQVWAVAFSGGAPKLLADGDMPVIAPTGDRVVYLKGNRLWTVPLDGSAAGRQLLFDRGDAEDPQFSPDGKTLAFVSRRGDHSFIALFTSDSAPIRYLAPSTSRDFSPRWSPDGTKIAFVRMPGAGGKPKTLLQQHPNPWAIEVVDVASGAAHQVWQSPKTLHGSYPTTDGQANLMYGAGGRIVFLSDVDGWPHLYAVSERGGAPTRLTTGKYMAENIAMSPDRTFVVYAANDGTTPDDVDRRHVYRVAVDGGAPVALTPGTGVEWGPVVTGDDASVVFLGATAQRPPLPGVVSAHGGAPTVLGASVIPADYPTSQLVTPKRVVFRASDGTLVHGQLFERAGGAARKPAVIFVHGGPPRQMLLGWHYMDYYSNAYAVNQYLANHGFVVLSVNYRLGIGYGHDFHHPDHAGRNGASEYLDVVAGNRYLRTLPEVDDARIGIWGGSYGGYLTALALARNSDLFAAGVDFHGVHDWISDMGSYFERMAQQYEKPADLTQAERVAWLSSPVADVAKWKSPVLLIQGDDDRNVHFHQTVDLAQRLAARKVSFEEMVIPNEIHGFLRWHSWLAADQATAAYLDRQLGAKAVSER